MTMKTPPFMHLRQDRRSDASLSVRELDAAITRFNQLHKRLLNRDYCSDIDTKIAILSEEVSLLLNLLILIQTRRRI